MNDKKRTEELLKMSIEDLEEVEKYIKELSSFLPLAVCTINPLKVALIANSAFQSLTGYKEVEIIGEKIEDLFLNKKDFNDLIKSKILEEETRLTRKMMLLTKEGEKIPVSMAISTRKDEEGNFIGYFIAFSDISDFEELRQSLEKRVRERTKQLQERVEELEKFRELTEGRELKMVELKEEIKKLKEELKKTKRSKIKLIEADKRG